MIIKIPVKKPAPSNETKTLPEKQESQQSIVSKITPHQHMPELVPFIDRMSVVVKIPHGDEGAQYYGQVLQQLNITQHFKAAKVWGKYKTARRVALDSVKDPKKWPLLQYAYDSNLKVGIEFRTEFSPFDLGLKGLEEYHLQLISIMDGGWQYFIKHGHVTMIELTVDIPDVSVDDFHLVPQQGPSAMTWKRDGKLETLVLGKPSGNQTKIYDRGEKRKAKGQKWTGGSVTRVEQRLKPGSALPLSKLSEQINPFKRLQLVAPVTACPPGEPKEYIWEMFLDSISVRTLPAALKLLSEEKRTLYRQWLLKHPVPWWQPDLIWAKWPEVLDDLKIDAISHWY